MLSRPIIGIPNSVLSKDNSYPEPLVSVIATLPSGYITSFRNVTIIGNGKLLISGDNQLLIYDGINWERISAIERPSPAIDSLGNVYFTINNRIELLAPNGKGSFTRKILIDSTLIPSYQRVTKLLVGPKQELYFSTNNLLWRMSNELNLIDSATNALYLLDNQKEIFYAKDGEGIFKFNINSLSSQLIPETEKFASKNLLQILEINNQPHAVISDYPWLINLKTGRNLSNVEHHINSRTCRILKAYQKNGEIYILTNDNGILILSDELDLISHVRNDAHNNLEQAIDILPFSEGTMLVLTKSSILRIFRLDITGLYPKTRILSSMPNRLIFHNNHLYCATSSSVYGTNYIAFRPNTFSFKQVNGINGSIDNFYIYKGNLFAAGNGGIYIINDYLSQKVSTDFQLGDLEFFNFVEHKGELWLIAALQNGVFAHCISDVSQESIHISFLNNSNHIENLRLKDDFLFALSSNGKWYKTNIFEEFHHWIELFKSNEENTNFHFPVGNDQNTFVVQSGNLYRFNHLNSTFFQTIVSDSLSYYSPILETESTLFIKRFFKVFPEVYSIWQYNSSKNDPIYNPFRLAASLPSGESINQALLLPDSTFLLSTTSGLYYFSNSKTLSNAFESIVSIFRVSLGSDKNKLYLKNGYIVDDSEALITKTSSVYRNLQFTLASIGCSEWGLIHGKVQYCSFLQGHDLDWTAWSSNQTRDVFNLSHGEYTLHVKARNFIGEESDIESISFVVLPMFFQTKLFVTAFIILGFVGLFMVYQWRRYMHAKERFKLESLINQRTEELVKEKEKTENLLARVLPKDTADELKEKGRVNTQRFQVVTVLFCDIEGFTRITDETNPEALIDQLDKFFLYFDSVVEKYRIEKIKTIGDAYMCAGGIPKKNQTNPVEVILAALEMMQYMKHLTTSKKNKSSVWDLRIGIDTGPVIAGVVGRNKLSYDIWGSTVNTASRMESSGESGQINISGNTYMLVKDYFICTFRGKMPVKNKGDIQMYFVNGIKPSLSENMKGIVPNQDFFIQLQIIRLGDLEDFILDKLEKGLPKNLYYHNLKHTVDVYTQVELIGRSENVTKEELLLLRTAALFHDAGHLIDYDTHEEMAVKLANEILPQYQYSDRQINIIAQLIMATKLPPNPTNLLEEIMCDADLDYLGRPDFIPVSNTLFKELHEHGKIGTEREWNEIQIKFINSHFYFTKTARRLRNVNKQSQLEKLKAWMDRN